MLTPGQQTSGNFHLLYHLQSSIKDVRGALWQLLKAAFSVGDTSFEVPLICEWFFVVRSVYTAHGTWRANALDWVIHGIWELSEFRGFRKRDSFLEDKGLSDHLQHLKCEHWFRSRLGACLFRGHKWLVKWTKFDRKLWPWTVWVYFYNSMIESCDVSSSDFVYTLHLLTQFSPLSTWDLQRTWQWYWFKYTTRKSASLSDRS